MMDDGEFDQRVRRAAAFGIPYDLAEAIWLVDVCGSRYRVGAAEVGVSEREFARRVRRARTAVQAQVAVAADRSPAARTTGAVGSVRRWVSTAALALVPMVAVAACGGESSDGQITISHIHDIVERDGELLLGTHQGLLRLEGDELQPVGDEVHDYMSVAVLSDGDLVASGHPDMRMEKYRVEGSPSVLGLIRSADGGQNWDIVDLLGQVDFHALAPSGQALYGGGSSGTIWEFRPGASTAHALGGIEQDLRDLAASPNDEGVLVTTSFDGRVAVTEDAAQTWEFPAGIPNLAEIEWTAGGITAVDLEGGVWAASDISGPYRQLGQAPDEVDALLVDSEGELWLGTHDGSVWSSSDGDDWNLVRAGSG